MGLGQVLHLGNVSLMGESLYADTYQVGNDTGSDRDCAIESMPYGPDRW